MSLAESVHLARDMLEESVSEPIHSLVKRVNITLYANSSAGLVSAWHQDPWIKAGQYSLGWVYFSILLLVATSIIHLYHMWSDKVRRALYKQEVAKASKMSSPDSDYEMTSLPTANSTARFFPREDEFRSREDDEESETPPPLQNVPIFDRIVAMLRWVFYRPIPRIKLGKTRYLDFPSAGAVFIILAALIFVILYTFIPQPLFYATIDYGSPPMAIRAGMIAVATMPWIIALSMKANLISVMTGIGHERLNVLHRWLGYICLVLSIIHTVPFYITPVWTDATSLQIFQQIFVGNLYPYATGLAALAPLLFLCVHSIAPLRAWMYEIFVVLHVPVSFVFLGMLFWHCNNKLTSWNFLWATVVIWVVSYIGRLFYLNWTNPRRASWLCGEESAITILPENAVKVTIPTQKKWKPGQYVYLRMPGISFFENHPFTIASLCSDDFPSEYGEQYRDMTLVFRPYGGFTRKVVDTAILNGPEQTYRAFIDGPYGGMQRELVSFDTVIMVAGGSGITAIVSQLLDLIKKMRDCRAVCKQVHVIWALKRPETMEWFKEELRICRQYAPPESVHCQFFITGAKRYDKNHQMPASPHRPVSLLLHEKVNDAFQGIASKRNSAIIREAAGGDSEKEREYRRENEDAIVALPQAYMTPQSTSHLNVPNPYAPGHKRQKPSFKIEIPTASATQGFDFGFPSTPTMLQKNLMRFAFLPSAATKKTGWHTEYGRPDIPFMLRGFQRDFGLRTCIFVCGPPSMRIDVQNCVARMQRQVLSDPKIDEIFLHTENYAI